MRSALLCVFFALIVHKEGSLAADEDFRPTPIPLNEWNGSSRERAEGAGRVDSPAGTLHQVVATDAPPAVAAIPAHYWEDALRHSVYLTLVRDKIDQLIAKSSVISPDTKPDQHEPKEVDDHDLWEKIKTAPFDRLSNAEPAYLGDITIISKGRLLQENSGLRFTEDEMSKEKCNSENCTEDVKAYWSVKRVRQREAETAPGKYHYELTFSVSSPKKQNKPYENPVRTFTVREGTPVERPQYRTHEPPVHAPRPQRAVWVHKNIVPTAPHQNRNQEDGLDRLFSSWFSLDEEPPVKRYKQVSYVPQMYPQRSKVGNVGAPTDNQKQMMPHPYKPQTQTSYKYGRPPLGPPPVSHTHSQHHYLDVESLRNQNQYTPPQTEYKHLSTNIVKTTKPAVLPTPPMSYAPLNISMEVTHNFNATESTPKDPEIITGFTMYSKPRPPPTKVSYFTEHVRPPVFNAPPGVFVTMDKKPFKPMPPLKYLHSHKPNKNKPIDFRPSPQVLDAQFSDPLSVPSTDSFRPITMSYGAANTTDSSEQDDGDIRAKPVRKSKPPKKHNNMKPHRTTTSTPEIITAHNEVLEELHWANILGAFAKTTPMASQKINVSEITTPIPFTTVSLSTTVSTPNTTETKMILSTKPSKLRRTRPPPKFTKPVKVKKHKRVTSTTTTSTTTTPTAKSHHRRPTQDLTPQASSSATGATKSSWQPKSKIHNATSSTTPMTSSIINDTFTSTTSVPSTTAKIEPTTYRAITTTRQRTTEAPSTTTDVTTVSTTLPKTLSQSEKRDKNRFRQSTLMYKGTSVNHDKWSSPFLTDKNKTTIERTKLVQSLSGKFPRRKGSNFQGYMSATRKIDEERNREDHKDHVFNPKLNVISLSSTSEATTEDVILTTPKPTQATYIESAEENEQSEFDDVSGTEDPDDEEDSEEVEDDNEAADEEEMKDQGEYIFDTSSTKTSKYTGSIDNSNEVEPVTVTTTQGTVVTSQYSIVKNKTKCKKKQNQESNSNKSASELDNEVSVAPIEITTEKLSTADFFDQIFGLNVDQNEPNTNQTDSKYVDSDEDLEEFLESINRKKDSNDATDEEYEGEEKDDEEENSPFNNDEENRFPRNADSSYEDYQDRPYSLLELMAME